MLQQPDDLGHMEWDATHAPKQMLQYRHINIASLLIDAPVVDCLIALAKGRLEDIYVYEDPVGQFCPWCSLNTQEQPTRRGDEHDFDCVTSIARRTLVALGLPLKRWHVTFVIQRAHSPNVQPEQIRLSPSMVEILHPLPPIAVDVAHDNLEELGIHDGLWTAIDPKSVHMQCVQVLTGV